jgi:hypothetical protein
MKLHNFLSLLLILLSCSYLVAQTSTDSTAISQKPKNADDPSSFLTRLEVFNEFQHYENGIELNQTVIRNIIKIGKKFTTRIDIPFVHNSFSSPAGYAQFGLGDISVRLLGYKLRETRFAAFTTSLEVQFNTAASPLLGTGKNLLIPLITYSDLLKSKKDLISGVFQQVITVGGNPNRPALNFTKIQAIYLHFWSRRVWSVVADEIFVDYEHDAQTSMIFKGRMVDAPTPRLNIWLQGNVGLYGDFVSRYQWGMEAGLRYYLLRSINLKKARLTKESDSK